MARLDIPYFDGLNAIVASNMAKPTEVMYSENAYSPMIGTIMKRNGTAVVGSGITPTDNPGFFFFSNSGADNSGLYRISTVGGVNSVYYMKTSTGVWTQLTGAGTNLSWIPNMVYDTAIAEDNLYFVNGVDANRMISSDGTTVTTSADSTGNLFNSPVAGVINYYKGHLYLADYTFNGVRYKTTVLKSSPQCGLICLITDEPLAPWTSIAVADTRYIYTTAPGNTLDVYRGNTKIAVLTVTSITNNILTCTTAFEFGQTLLLSADEIWAPGTFTGKKQFRWSFNPSTTGTTVKEYDNFKFPGPANEEVKMMTNINNMMVIANNSSLAVWNDYTLQAFDAGNGCVSKNGWVKCLGTLYYMHYSGIYATTGGAPQLISSKIEPYISGATTANLEKCAAGKKDKSVYFAIGDVTLYNPDGSAKKPLVGSSHPTLHDVVLEYSVTQQNWFVHTGINAKQFLTFIDSTSPDRCLYTTMSTTLFPVLEYGVGSTDHLGAPIQFRIETPNLSLSKQFETISYPTEIAVEMERGSQLKCFVSLDMGNFYELDGEAGKGCTVFKVNAENGEASTPQRCRNIRISLREYSRQLCKVSKVSIIYTSSSEFEEHKDDYIDS